GNDHIRGGRGNDELHGSLHRDRLIGGYGNDTLLGGGGNDTLVGGAGADRLGGGPGRDVFRFVSFSDSRTRMPDTIGDFETGRDDIDLAKFDLTYIGGNAFTGARQLRWEPKRGHSLVSIDLDGNGQADMAIKLTGRISLTEDDFLF
ncbi:M10 family metallopeptidase C-terminal domain-containing protein, partial [Paracoccus methylarcula]